MKARIFILALFFGIFNYSVAQPPLPPPGTICGDERPIFDFTLNFSNEIVGKINDNLEVGLSGLLNYEIPISVPPGTGGMTPQLSLSYTSTQGDGLLGSGFELGGLSIINRCPTNLHIDGGINPINLVRDEFMLDGLVHDKNK